MLFFSDETTRTKFLFYGGNDYQASGGLSEFITAHDLPDFLGGPCKVYIFNFENIQCFYFFVIDKFEYFYLGKNSRRWFCTKEFISKRRRIRKRSMYNYRR